MKLFDLWPNFLKDIVDFQEIAEALQPEIDDFNLAVHDMHKEFSLFTMTEYGCGRWEAIMGIIPPAGDNLENRRQRILARYLSQLPYTYRRLLQYLQQTTQGCVVDLDAANYYLFVRVRVAGYSLRTALLATLTEMLPANLVLELMVEIPQAVENAKLCAAVQVVFPHIEHTCYPVER